MHITYILRTCIYVATYEASLYYIYYYMYVYTGIFILYIFKGSLNVYTNVLCIHACTHTYTTCIADYAY